jgi:hypothetical protein
MKDLLRLRVSLQLGRPWRAAQLERCRRKILLR